MLWLAKKSRETVFFCVYFNDDRPGKSTNTGTDSVDAKIGPIGEVLAGRRFLFRFEQNFPAQTMSQPDFFAAGKRKERRSAVLE